MQLELLSVGTELLLGEIVDTNAAYLADKLSELGINVYHKTTVGDNTERLAAALRISLARADAILATGGLGPTDDDITAAAIAQVAGVDLVEDEPTADRIRSFASKASFARKVSFGSQSDAGARTREILMSILLTLKQRFDDFQTRFKNALDHLAQNPNLDPYNLLFKQNSSQPAHN